MSRRFGILTAVAVLIGVPTVGWAAVGTPSKGVAHSGAGSLDLEFVAYRTQYKIADVGQHGPSIGDTYVEFGPVERNGERVGRHGDDCTVVRATDDWATYTCLSIVRLPEGQLTMQGLVRVPSSGGADYTFAVTGGTGEYAGAGGQAHVTGSGAAADGQLFEVDLT